MTAEDIFGMILMFICCFGCGMLFLGLGLHAQKCRTPVGFWAGKEINPRWVSDVSGYNRESAAMWKVYSIPYFAAAILSCFWWVHEAYAIASTAILIVAGGPGIWLLIRCYRKIEGKYFDQNRMNSISQENNM